MSRYVYRWECVDGTSCFKGGKVRTGSSGHVFTTLKSAMMWVKDLGIGYDNYMHKDLVLCIYKADACYPTGDVLYEEDITSDFISNGISDWCNEFYAIGLTDRTPISYMTYKELVAFSKLLRKCKSQRALKEFLGLDPKYDLRGDHIFQLKPGEQGIVKYEEKMYLVQNDQGIEKRYIIEG